MKSVSAMIVQHKCNQYEFSSQQSTRSEFIRSQWCLVTGRYSIQTSRTLFITIVMLWRKSLAFSGNGTRAAYKVGYISAMFYNAFSNLVVINDIQTSATYPDDLCDGLLDFPEHAVRDTLRFQQDNASKKTRIYIIDWLDTNHLYTVDWAANPPDINPIRKFVGNTGTRCV